MAKKNTVDKKIFYTERMMTDSKSLEKSFFECINSIDRTGDGSVSQPLFERFAHGLLI